MELHLKLDPSSIIIISNSWSVWRVRLISNSLISSGRLKTGIIKEIEIGIVFFFS